HACIGYLRFDVGGLVDFQIGQFVTSLKDIFRISITTLFQRYSRLPNGLRSEEILIQLQPNIRQIFGTIVCIIDLYRSIDAILLVVQACLDRIAGRILPILRPGSPTSRAIGCAIARIKARAKGLAIVVATALLGKCRSRPQGNKKRSEERRVGKECRARWAPYT